MLHTIQQGGRASWPWALGLLCALLGSATLSAQQDYHFTQFNFNKLALNPAYAGSRELFSTSALYRHQWTGFEGAPRTVTLGLHSPVGEERLALGALFFSDRLGVSSQTALYADVAYRLPLGNNSKLSVGLQGGFLHYRNEVTRLNPRDAGDVLLLSDVGALFPNVGFGVYWSSDRSFAGVSMPHVVRNDLTRLGDFDDERTGLLYRHLYVMGGHVFDLNETVKMRPSALLKWVGGDGIAAPLDMDFNLSFLFLDRLWLGTGYRLKESVNWMAEFQITDQLMTGYSYDLSLTDMRIQQGGTHEVMVRYELRFNKANLVTPRYIRYF
jgi:type IX secretion system PorP/SprF family membrane protein